MFNPSNPLATSIITMAVIKLNWNHGRFFGVSFIGGASGVTAAMSCASVPHLEFIQIYSHRFGRLGSFLRIRRYSLPCFFQN